MATFFATGTRRRKSRRVASEPASNEGQVAGPQLRARQRTELDARERRHVAAQQSSQTGVVKAGPAPGFALWPRGECILSRVLSPRASAVGRTAPAMSLVLRSSAAWTSGSIRGDR